MATRLLEEGAAFRSQFVHDRALLFEEPFEPDTLGLLMSRAVQTQFVGEDVPNVGKREVEASRGVGAAVGLFLGRENFMSWIEAATGLAPVRAVSGRLVQTRAGGVQELGWHDDQNEAHRLLGIVINLSDSPFDGGLFEMREVGSVEPFLTHHHSRQGSMLIFAVNSSIEHRVTAVDSGGPRRVYAGWFLCEPVQAKPG